MILPVFELPSDVKTNADVKDQITQNERTASTGATGQSVITQQSAIQSSQFTQSSAQPAQSQPPISTYPANLKRAPNTTSLKSLVKEPEAAYQSFKPETNKQSNSFTQEDLQRYWDEFSETLEEKVHLKNTMINHKPVLLDDFKFEVRVHNPVQKEELLNSSLQLIKLLRTRLKNDLVQMTIHVDENIERKTAYSSADKFELLHKINPMIAKLVQEFDLTIE